MKAGSWKSGNVPIDVLDHCVRELDVLQMKVKREAIVTGLPPARFRGSKSYVDQRRFDLTVDPCWSIGFGVLIRVRIAIIFLCHWHRIQEGIGLQPSISVT